MAIGNERSGHIFYRGTLIEPDFERSACRITGHDDSRTDGIEGAFYTTEIQKGGNFALEGGWQRQNFRFFAEIGDFIGVIFGIFCPLPHRELRKTTTYYFR